MGLTTYLDEAPTSDKFIYNFTYRGSGVIPFITGRVPPWRDYNHLTITDRYTGTSRTPFKRGTSSLRNDPFFLGGGIKVNCCG